MTKQTEVQTEAHIRAVSTQWAASRAPEGLIINSQNGALVQTYLASRGLPVTLENLSSAVAALGSNLLWQSGYGPTAPKPARKLSPAQEKANAEQKLMDNGIHIDRRVDHSDPSETPYHKDFRAAVDEVSAGKEAKQKAAARWAEENQTIYNKSGPRPGSVNHAETEAVRQEARQRHAREDAGGKSSAAAAGLPTQIPLNADTSELKKFTPDQIRNWMKRRRAAGYSV